MIPFIHVPDLPIGPLTLHPFGLLVATGVLIGSALAVRRARFLGYDPELMNSFNTWCLAGGFIGGHVLDEIFYHPEEILRRPWSLLMLWEGLSSFGGFTGAILTAFLWKYVEWRPKRPGQPWGFRLRSEAIPVLPILDVNMAIFPVGWVFGRSGCSVVHDHPGARAAADSLLAVAYPIAGPMLPVTKEGVPVVPAHVARSVFGPITFFHGAYPRYDLGFLELLFTIVLALLIALTWRRRHAVGTYVAVTALAYAPVRFVLDFVRITEGEAADKRYLQLTFAQWMCVLTLALGLFVVAYMRQCKARGVDLGEPIRKLRLAALLAPLSTSPELSPPSNSAEQGPPREG